MSGSYRVRELGRALTALDIVINFNHIVTELKKKKIITKYLNCLFIISDKSVCKLLQDCLLYIYIYIWILLMCALRAHNK